MATLLAEVMILSIAPAGIESKNLTYTQIPPPGSQLHLLVLKGMVVRIFQYQVIASQLHLLVLKVQVLIKLVVGEMDSQLHLMVLKVVIQ